MGEWGRYNVMRIERDGAMDDPRSRMTKRKFITAYFRKKNAIWKANWMKVKNPFDDYVVIDDRPSPMLVIHRAVEPQIEYGE